MEWMETRVVLASCAASILLFMAFATFSATAVALFGAWRGLRFVRSAVPPQAARVEGYLQIAQSHTNRTADRVVRPQIRLLSFWAGLLAALRALFAWSGTRR